MSAVVSVRDSTSKALDLKATPDEVIAPEDVADTSKLARLLTRILGELASFRRRFTPRRTTFRDIVSTGTAGTPYTVRLPHRFGGRVEWTLAGVRGAGVVVTPLIEETSASDKDTLELKVFFPATVAIRVEEGG